jgi:6-phosphogluconate dehydrogenase
MELMPLLEEVSAKDPKTGMQSFTAQYIKWVRYYISGRPCVTFIGPRGAGHYVKMVHNGLVYLYDPPLETQ